MAKSLKRAISSEGPVKAGQRSTTRGSSLRANLVYGKTSTSAGCSKLLASGKDVVCAIGKPIEGRIKSLPITQPQSGGNNPLYYLTGSLSNYSA